MIKPDQITEAAFHSSNDTMLASTGAKVSGLGVGTSLIGWLSTNEAVIFIGVIVTVLGFVGNMYFQWKRDKRAKARDELETRLLLEEHDIKMQNYKKENS